MSRSQWSLSQAGAEMLTARDSYEGHCLALVTVKVVCKWHPPVLASLGRKGAPLSSWVGRSPGLLLSHALAEALDCL